MTRHGIPHDALIFVGDGRKALFLRNDGDAKFPNFVTEQVFADENPPSHEQGTDRPGKSFARAHTSRHSAMEPTDWHDIEEHRFAERVAGALEMVARARSAPALVIVAPPRTLADIRGALGPDTKAKVVLELNKDLTKTPVWDIEKHVMAALATG
jgi:protein required for attachment to host cells